MLDIGVAVIVNVTTTTTFTCLCHQSIGKVPSDGIGRYFCALAGECGCGLRR